LRKVAVSHDHSFGNAGAATPWSVDTAVPVPDREVSTPVSFGRTYSGVCAVGQAAEIVVLAEDGEGAAAPDRSLCDHDRDKRKPEFRKTTTKQKHRM
jgi:hypothetical protein